MLWANTTNIGCGYIYYDLKGNQIKVARLICNYGATGNFFGKTMYEVAEKNKEENEVLEKEEEKISKQDFEQDRASLLKKVLSHAKSILLPVLNGIFRSK